MPNIIQKVVNFFTADVVIATTVETVVQVSDFLDIPYDSARLVVKAWVQLTSGAAVTAFTLRIRRGSLVTDPLVGEANAEQLSVAAGSTESHAIEVSEQLQAQGTVRYVLTVQQTGGAANGAALQGIIEVECMNG